ncbi:hypothetical protein ACOSQ2_016519 [Xanthoceras sorbifolium]
MLMLVIGRFGAVLDRVPLLSNIHTFLCSLFHEKILTNKQRVIRGLATDEVCPRCCVGIEDIDHLLRGFVVSVDIWEQRCRGCTKTINFRSDFHVWLCSNLQDTSSSFAGFPNYL